MEPLDDKELTQLLRQWEAPRAPADLQLPLAPQGAPQAVPWWRWLLTGTIRIPVPLGVVAVLALAAWIFLDRPAAEPAVQVPAEVSLADFQPVKQLEPTVVEKDSGGKNDEYIQQYK